MAHRWDSYFHDLPPVSSDPQTLRRTSESEGSLSQHIENITGHHDFPGSVASCESPAPDSDFNTNYFSNSSIGNSSSDSVYQRYYKETPWQADGEQMEKDYLPRCGNGDTDFATDGLSTSESFPSSFAADLQGIKQDCGMLATSFLEDYSDVSSCSDPDVGETRPSCKFMAGNSVPKPKPCVSIKNSSSEWLFTHTENMTFPTESSCPNMSENNVILPTPSNENANENTIEYVQHKMESPENTVKSYTEYNQSSTTTNMVTTPVSETVVDGNDYDGCQDHKKQKENVESDLIQGEYSNISISGHENLTGDGIENYPFDNDEEQSTATAPNIMTIFDNEQDDFNEKLLTMEMKESFNQENERLGHPSSLDGQDKNMKGDTEDKCEVLRGEIKQPGSSENENSEKHKSPNPNSTDVQDENMDEDKRDKSKVLKGEMKDSSLLENENSGQHELSNPNSTNVQNENKGEDKQDKIEVLKGEMKDSGAFENENSNMHKSSNPNSIDVQDENMSEDEQVKSEIMKVEIKEPGSLENENSDKQKSSNLNSSHVQDENVETDCLEKEIQSNTSQSSDPGIKTSNCEEAIKLGESLTTLKSIRHDAESCLQLSERQSHKSVVEDNICWSPAVKSNDLFSDASDKNEGSVATQSESSLELNSFNTDVNPCLEKEWTSAAKKTNITSSPDPDCNGPGVSSDNLSIDTSDIKKQDIASHAESCLQPYSSSKDINPFVEEDITSLPEKKTMTSPSDPDCSGPLSTSDNKEQCRLESCSQSKTLCTDIDPHLEKEWTNPAENTNTTSSPDQQQSLHRSPVSQELKNLSEGVAENAMESFEGLDTSEEPSVIGVLFGEPLSREDSSCDTNETKLDSSQYKDTSLARPDRNSIDHSEGQEPQLESSIQMRKYLQPVVILKTFESVNGMDNYRCADCQHTTQHVYQLIEHYHCSHSVNNFQFCKTCNVYLVRNDQAEKHVCVVTKESPQLSNDSSLQKKKCLGRHRCKRCGVRFSKLYQYVKHMRTHTGKTPFRCKGCGLYFAQSGSLLRHRNIPGRCKLSKLQPVMNSDAVISETKMPPQNDLVKSECVKLPECYIKLVDISKTHTCRYCGKSFLNAEKTKKHFYNVHMGKHLAVSLSKSTTRLSGENIQKVENETRGKYKCPLCPRLFKYTHNRARHLRDCVKDKTFGGKEKVAGKYRCPLCYATFTLASNRYRHINTFCLSVYVNQLAKQNAKPRQKSERKRQELQAVTAPKIEPRYRCTLCPAVFWHPSGIYRHRKKHELFKLTGKMFKYRNSVSSTMSKPPTLRSPKTEESKDNSKSAEAIPTLSLSCHFCGKCFSTSQSLKKHESNHKGERPYRCLECGKGFKRRTYLIGHKSVHQRRIQCTVCKKILPTIRELIQHRSSHLKRGMLQCPDCHLQFQYPAHLLRHLDRHKKREIKAPQLEERSQLKLQQSLETMKVEGGEKQLQCSLCQEVFSDAQVLRKHCLTHISGPLSHQCPFCRQNLTNRKCLLRHMIKHTGDKPFSCTNCGKQFYRDIYLQHHSKQCLPAQTRHPVTIESDVKPKTKGSHQCSYCPRMFCKKIRLKNHHRGHKNKSLLRCSTCGQYYGTTKLRAHQKNCVGTEFNSGLSSPNGDNSQSPSQTRQNVHKMGLQSSSTKILQWKCPHCTQRFRYRSLLLRHVVSHTGVQPYPCAHCGQRFASQTTCMQHEASCNNVNKEGQSKVNSDAAKQLSNMPTLTVVAQKLQAPEADYKCRFCTKTFMKPRNLRRHILTHNEVKPYRCKACDNCFSRYDHLKVHQIRCKERRSRLEVCIPKISLDDVGKGWQNKFNLEPLSEKQETFECAVCSRSFPTQAKLSRHNTLFHGTKLFKCAGCGSSFSHEKSLKHHRKVKRCRKLSNETNAPLQVGKIPPTEDVTKPLDGVRNKILQRIQPHFSKKYKYMCSYCPRAFGNGYQLRVHTRLHTGERPFACDYCDERFIRKDYVLRHLPKCTKKTRQKVLCDRCGGFFPQVKLESHKKSCTSTSSSSKSTVDQSQQSSSKGPPKGFSCAYCSSRFLLFSQLQEHFLNEHKMETMVPPVSTVPLQHHLSNIPNIKEEPLDKSCNEQPSDSANLICKLDTALDGEVSKSFSCSECNMSFVNKAGLTGHQRVHTKETPFNCKTCKKGFWNKLLHRNHYRKCRSENNSERNSTLKFEVPLKAEIDFALNDSVLVFDEGSKTIGTGTNFAGLQTNFSCKEDLSESPQNSEENEVQGSSSKEKAVQYQCSECDQSFTDGLMLISHLEDHGREEQEKKRTTCSKCGRVFSSQGFLEKHMRIHGINKKYSCPDCPEMFYNSSDLEAHTVCHDLHKPFPCKLCNERFWTRPSLCNHYSEEHPDDVFTCRFCSKAYSVKKSLARHYKKWHQQEQKDCGTVQEKRIAEKQSSSQASTTESYEDSEDSDSDSAPYFPCHVCGKTFTTSESLEDHQRCHLGEKPHECAECGRCFFQASQLQQHQRMHKSEFQCQACGRGFVSLFALRKHKHTHGKSRPYRCTKCDFSFTGPSQLAEHMSTHREENFPCDICNRVFVSKSSRAEHRKCHSKSGNRHSHSVSKEEHKKSDSLSEVSSAFNKELKYRCGVCSERFRDPEELSEHGCLEAKERPYSCSDCNKHFLHASHLKKHRTTHQLSSGGKYPCNQCNNSFSSSKHFLSHLKSHVYTTVEIKCETEDGDPSYSFTCPVCHQSFDNATELIKHFPTHPDSSFECKICKMTFLSESKLEEHERHHLTSATQYECTKCGQSFLGSNTFRQHNCFRQQLAVMVKDYSNPLSKTSPTHQAPGEEEDVDVTGEDFYFCPVCSMQFSSKSSLLEHQNKQHPNEKPFRCELCGKTFALRRYLREHERRHRQKSATQTTAHLAENKLKCTQCQTEFKTAQELSLHLRFHAEKDVGEFRCDMCYKSFSQWSLLKQHQESHVGQVVYECNECDKAFAFPHLLEEHQLTHAGSSQ